MIISNLTALVDQILVPVSDHERMVNRLVAVRNI